MSMIKFLDLAMVVVTLSMSVLAVENHPTHTIEITFQSKKHIYRIASTGKVELEVAGAPRRVFSLPMLKDEVIEAARIIPYENDLIFIYQASDGEGAGNHLVRIDPATYQPIWKQWIPAFNVSKPTVGDASLFIGASGFIGKVKLQTGK